MCRLKSISEERVWLCYDKIMQCARNDDEKDNDVKWKQPHHHATTNASTISCPSLANPFRRVPCHPKSLLSTPPRRLYTVLALLSAVIFILVIIIHLVPSLA
jgi:hypothetical protein